MRRALVAVALAALAAGGAIFATGAFDSDDARASCDPAEPFQRARPLSEGFAYRPTAARDADAVVAQIKAGTERSDYGRDDVEGRLLQREGRTIAAVWSARPPDGVPVEELTGGLLVAAQRAIPNAKVRTADVELDVHPAKIVRLETRRGIATFVVAQRGCRAFVAQGSEGVAMMRAVELLVTVD